MWERVCRGKTEGRERNAVLLRAFIVLSLPKVVPLQRHMMIIENGKEEIEEIIRFALEMCRRVKEQLKKLGGMEFYDVNFSYIDNETFEEQ